MFEELTGGDLETTGEVLDELKRIRAVLFGGGGMDSDELRAKLSLADAPTLATFLARLADENEALRERI